jgi:hypothetical protein
VSGQRQCASLPEPHFCLRRRPAKSPRTQPCPWPPWSLSSSTRGGVKCRRPHANDSAGVAKGRRGRRMAEKYNKVYIAYTKQTKSGMTQRSLGFRRTSAHGLVSDDVSQSDAGRWPRRLRCAPHQGHQVKDQLFLRAVATHSSPSLRLCGERAPKRGFRIAPGHANPPHLYPLPPKPGARRRKDRTVKS